MQEQHRVGMDSLEAVTALLHRVSTANPTAGLLEAADFQWWWRTPRPTDTIPHLFWFDDLGHPEAAVIATDWGDAVALDPLFMPDVAPDWKAHVIERGLAHASACGFDAVDVVIDRADDAMREMLVGHGFTRNDDGTLEVVLAWLEATARPEISLLHEGYQLHSRLDTMEQPHHMAARNGTSIEERLRQTSLYRPDLDLLVLADSGDVAAYSLFWFDPATLTGLVEPMRTEAGHRRRGLARHLLTAGIARLVEAGATRIKLCYNPNNPGARDLYLDVGFKPYKQTAVLSRTLGA